jgi:hypothetical protein
MNFIHEVSYNKYEELLKITVALDAIPWVPVFQRRLLSPSSG